MTKTISASSDFSAFVNIFVKTSGVILFITGFAKIWSAVSPAEILNTPDPITGLDFGYLFLVIGVLEVSVASICFISKRPFLSSALVTWLALGFLFYRIGLWWVGWRSPCSCLGNLTDALHISPRAADLMMKGVLAYLIAGGAMIGLTRMRLFASFFKLRPPSQA